MATVEEYMSDEEVVENEEGGKQTNTDFDFTLIDPYALFQLSNVLEHGRQKYGKDNWRKITIDENLNHAVQHVYAYLAREGDAEKHLSHAFTRLMMALARFNLEREGKGEYKN